MTERPPPVPNKLTPIDLQPIAAWLYDTPDRWKAPLARDLNINRTTVGHWTSGRKSKTAPLPGPVVAWLQAAVNLKGTGFDIHSAPREPAAKREIRNVDILNTCDVTPSAADLLA